MRLFNLKTFVRNTAYTWDYAFTRRCTTLVAVFTVLCTSSSFADDKPAADTSSTTKEVHVRNAGEPEKRMIPASIRQLKLTNDQDKKIEDIAESYEKTISSVLKQFNDQYMQTIAVETSMLAAIEDTFTDDQRTRVRDVRRKTAQHESATKVEEKPIAPVKQIDVVKEELANTGISLSHEQQEAADAIQLKYRAHLRQLNQRILDLHNRLISLEAEKLAAIEKELTKDQLSELRTNRQTAPRVSGAVTSAVPQK